MFFSASSAVAAVSVASVVNAHMLMNTPKPFSTPQLQNGPLEPSGNNFPCQSTGGAFVADGTTEMALGSQQPLRFTGQAVHGGGSCQVSISYDTQPTKDSVWKVIHSIEGGCPAIGQTGNAGNSAAAEDPDTYKFTIPTNIPTGNATLAWTWFNKIGNREMYMNCAPIAITGSGSGDRSGYEKLPDIFKANIGNGCGTVSNTDLVFPDPGDSVERLNGNTKAFAAPTGSCAAGSGSGSGSGVGDGAGSGAIATATAPVTSSPAGSYPAPSAPAAAPTEGFPGGRPGGYKSIPGGVFLTVPAVERTTLAPIAKPTPSTPGTGSGSGSGNSSGPGSGSSAGSTGVQSIGSACTPEGQWNCVDGSSFQQCANGVWSVVQPLAAGTSCVPGLGSTIKMVIEGREKRFVMSFRG